MKFIKVNFSRKQSEAYLVKNEDQSQFMEITEDQLIAQAKKYDSKTYVKGLNEDEKPIPISPTLRPIQMTNLKMDHKYYWCSCGMSDK